ncbi:hypothetical protein [uncultured Erythrobacter sp.]|uniref:hypothetical protein n=1 Tax=uncultured Erythrobacter sp. TaxID=263913 RepID=UPI002628630F|nr:hypothetical protein [uncultured Erythrobacter sp.]
MKFAKLAVLATAIAATPIAANAQDVGATVYGNDDAPIGTVAANEGGVVTVDTGKHSAPLPANLLAEREGNWTVNATKAQIDGMMDAQVAAANQARDAALVEGAAVVSADGMPAGTVYTIDDADTAIVQSEAGIITLTRESFTVDPSGRLMALYSAEQLAANTVAVPEGAEILTPAQAAAKEAEMAAAEEGEAAAGASE